MCLNTEQESIDNVESAFSPFSKPAGVSTGRRIDEVWFIWCFWESLLNLWYIFKCILTISINFCDNVKISSLIKLSFQRIFFWVFSPTPRPNEAANKLNQLITFLSSPPNISDQIWIKSKPLQFDWRKNCQIILAGISEGRGDQIRSRSDVTHQLAANPEHDPLAQQTSLTLCTQHRFHRIKHQQTLWHRSPSVQITSKLTDSFEFSISGWCPVLCEKRSHGATQWKLKRHFFMVANH